MFHTPPRSKTMVNTRSTARNKEKQLKGADSVHPRMEGNKEDENLEKPQQGIPTVVPKSVKSKSSRKTSSSTAQKKKLELQAAKEKARIEIELIEKQLEADLAALDEKYSPCQSECSSGGDRPDIERWLESSQQEVEQQKTGYCAGREDRLCESPVRQLASAIKDLVATSTAGHSASLLGRISTSRELPVYSGDLMEWLSFKNAYEESTTICNFTEKENLWRLRKCLRGPAKEAVSALLISTTSPTIVMSTLELQFGNPDLIISRILQEVKKLHPLSQEYHKDIVPFSIKIKNFVVSVQELKREEYLHGVGVVDMVLSKLPPVLLSKWADFSYPLITESKKSRLSILSDFLNMEAIKTSTCSANLMHPRWDSKRKYSDNNNYTHTQTCLLQSGKDEQNEKCRYCHTYKHKLTDCKKFKKSLRKDRWFYVRRAGLCFKCLILRHDRQTCPAAPCDVNGCGEPHHRLLHYTTSARTNSDAPQTHSSDTTMPTETETSEQSESVTHINTNNCSVLLKVVPVNVHGPNGVFRTGALLDDGSTVSIMSSSLAERAGIHGRKQSMRVRGAWDNTELLCETELLDLTLSNTAGEKFDISVRSVKELNLPRQNFNIVQCEKYKHLLELRDELYCAPLKPEVLIGQDNYDLLLPLETVLGGQNEPCATRTPLGWCLHGRVPLGASATRPCHSTLFITAAAAEEHAHEDSLRDLHDVVTHFFSLESMGTSAAKPRENSEDQRAWEHLEKTSTLVDGKWQVGLPWKNNNCTMPDSLPMAISRLKHVEQKMKKNIDYAERYYERLQHLFENDYAKELKNNEITPKTWYLPHFGVDNLNKKKLRLVFDAAAKTCGLSLNDYLLTGPDLLMSLFGIMLRFRENAIAVTADIKDMFLRVKIRPEDQDALRFIFRGDPSTKYDPKVLKESLKTYAMTSLIFGANCSPFIAQFVKNKNAQRYETEMPTAAAAIYTQHYMDDYIDSLPDEETTKKLIQEIIYIHSQGDFELRNWNSNSQTVLNSVPKQMLGSTAVKFKLGQQNDGERTLGLIWHPEDDTLRIDVSFKKIPQNIINGDKIPTKREILRVIMSIFDVYGFLSPFIINGKIILQETWRLKIGWDDPISKEINSKWIKWTDLLKTLHNVKLPRYYAASTASANEVEPRNSQGSSTHKTKTTTASCATTDATTEAVSELTTEMEPVCYPTKQPASATQKRMTAPNDNKASCYNNLQMHIFCDASTQAICAVAYWRWIDNDFNIHVAFIASKCRVAGNKPITVPRLELQAAVLGARLANTIAKEHRMTAEQRIFWSDSTTVLHWVKNDARNYSTYVANRLGEIDDLTKTNEWRYIPTKLNVADIATRESYDDCCILQNEWLHGPTFLREEPDMWPLDVINLENKDHKLECLTVIQMKNEILPVPEPTKFSTWIRLLRSMARVLTFVDKGMKAIQQKFEDRKFTFNLNDDIMEKAEKLLLRYSQLQSFSKEIHLLRNGEAIPTTSKLLTLTPYLDEWGVLRAGGRIDAADVVPEMKRPVILDGENYITRLIIRHYHVQAAHGNQEMVVNNLKQKFWIVRLRPTVKNVVKRCMFCRIRKCKPEIPKIGDLPYARMAHHQRPFSYCGVDLFGPMEVTVGRRHEHRYGVLFTCLTVRAVHIEIVPTLTTDSFIMALRRMAARRGWPHQLYSDNGTNLRGADTELRKSWKDVDEGAIADEAANHGTKWTFIPPASPHWGGAWERLIRSVKTSLQVVLRERAPRDETLSTLLAEVENIINSRPLTHVAVEFGSKETLTPNHFLLGSSSNIPPIGKFDDLDLSLRKQWRISQRLADMFWNRWVREILPDLIPRKKWNQDQRPLEVGDLVLIVDPTGPRSVWPKGIIEEVCPGKDGRIRVVKIKTKRGILTRSAARVARIPMEEECC